MFFNLFNISYLLLLAILTKVIPERFKHLHFTIFGILFVSYYSLESVLALVLACIVLLISNYKKSISIAKYLLATAVVLYFSIIWIFSLDIKDDFPYELLVLMWFNLARYWHVWIDYCCANNWLQSRQLLSYLWFPTILFAGPMETYQDFARFDEKPKAVNYEIVVTLLFTALLSGTISYLINQYLKIYSFGFNNETLLSVFMYVNLNAILIFFDMSSWICLARSFAHLMGYPFDSINFKLFILSKNPVQFWNRWNMSFTRWIQKYIFASNLTLFMNNRRRIVSWTIAWFICCGLLHKYSMQFVIWGSLHALGIIVTHGFLRYKMKLQKIPLYNKFVYRGISIFITMIFLHITCIFMSPHYEQVVSRYIQLFTLWF
ncbi:MAG: hypothetical protein KC646_05185 [Candidatus Cloacimonetes bacterium]|nr:hypothetical protein [Candidatus Cloacimonadota bacterium]